MLLYNSHFRFFAGKLLSKWEGPYVIEEVYRSGAIKINNPEGTNPKVVNGQRIKHYISDLAVWARLNLWTSRVRLWRDGLLLPDALESVGQGTCFARQQLKRVRKQ